MNISNLKMSVILFLIFVSISFCQKSNSDGEDINPHPEITDAEKNRIRSFWEVYRKATKSRINGNWEQAATEYEMALALNDSHEDALYYLGNMYLETGKFKDAEQVWKKLVRLNSTNSRAHFQLGHLYLNYKQPLFSIENAEYEFKKALAINREESGPILALGQVELIRANRAAARNSFEAVLATNFRSVEAHFLYGYILWKSGKSTAAQLKLITAREHLDAPQPIKGVLGEGDTKSGESFVRLTEHSLFGAFNHKLEDIAISELHKSVESCHDFYKSLDDFVEEVRNLSN